MARTIDSKYAEGLDCPLDKNPGTNVWDNSPGPCTGINDCDQYVQFDVKPGCICNSATCPNKRGVSVTNRYTINEPQIGDYIQASDINEIVDAIKAEVNVRYNDINTKNHESSAGKIFKDADVKGTKIAIINDAVATLPTVAVGDTILGEHFYKIRNILNDMLANDGFDNLDYKNTLSIKVEYTQDLNITAAHINELVSAIQFIGRQCLCNSRFVCSCYCAHDDNMCSTNILPSCKQHCACRTVCTRCNTHCPVVGQKFNAGSPGCNANNSVPGSIIPNYS